MTGEVGSSNKRFNEMVSIPVLVRTGKIVVSLAVAISVKPNAFGMEGPVRSASMMAVFSPFLLALTASKEVVRDLPTPPLPETTAITFLTLLNSLAWTRKLSGPPLRLGQFSTPQEPQLLSQSGMLFSFFCRNQEIQDRATGQNALKGTVVVH